jgi:serine/threonine-protein kinase
MAALRQNEIFASRYLLAGKIGEGGFSEVWKAYDTKADDALVAIKIYAPGKGLDDYGIRQFRKEYAITHPLSHPNLIKLYHFDTVDDSPYLIMPFYEKGSIGSYLQKHGPFNDRELATLMYQIGSALAELHKQQPSVLHQDIKPDNILMHRNEQFILTDFGISSQTRHTVRKDTADSKPLTIAYAPPERFAAVPVVAEPGDIFAFGVTLYEMCTGQVPWIGGGGATLLNGAQVPNLPPSFDIELNKIIHACMAIEWENRPTAQQISRWGKFYLDNGFWRFSSSETRRRQLRYSVAAAVGIVLLAGGGAFWYIQSGKEPVKNTPLTSIPTQTEASVILAGDSNTRTGLLVDSASAADGLPVQTPPVQTPPAPRRTAGTAYPARKVQKNTRPDTPGVASTVGDPLESLSLEESLNRIADGKVARSERKALRKKVLALFANASVPVYDNASGIETHYSAEGLLDKLLISSYHVKVRETERDAQERITSLFIQTKDKP